MGAPQKNPGDLEENKKLALVPATYIRSRIVSMPKILSIYYHRCRITYLMGFGYREIGFGYQEILLEISRALHK